MESFGINKAFWDKLSKADQKMFEAAAALENNLLYSEYCWNNGSSMKKLVEEHGVQLREFSDDIFDAAGEATAEVFEEYRADSNLTARVLDSMLAARKSVGSWMNLSEVPFIAQRNRVLGI
jgi:TRAP-type mannitol/chloroaromatic compound transport system substrate-binding protein